MQGFSLDDRVEKATKKKAKKANSPQEAFSGSMTPPHSLPQYGGGLVWRPNNYRRRMKIKFRKISPQEIKESAKQATFISYGSVTTIVNFEPNITLQLGKNFLVGIWKQHQVGKHKMVYHIEADTEQQLQDFLNKKKLEIQSKIDVAMFRFARSMKIANAYEKPVWIRFEDFIKGDYYLDQIPVDMVIHDTHFKKVYGKGIEFMQSKPNENPTVKMKTFIKNRALEDLEPRLLGVIRDILVPPIEAVAQQLEIHNDALVGINNSMKKFNVMLDRWEKKTREKR